MEMSSEELLYIKIPFHSVNSNEVDAFESNTQNFAEPKGKLHSTMKMNARSIEVNLQGENKNSSKANDSDLDYPDLTEDLKIAILMKT